MFILITNSQLMSSSAWFLRLSIFIILMILQINIPTVVIRITPEFQIVNLMFLVLSDIFRFGIFIFTENIYLCGAFNKFPDFFCIGI